MKELSIDEKAKRYDEALKVLHKYDGANIMFSQSLKEEMFPELKESEGEKIRNALIKFHKSTIDIDGIKGSDIVTWLEKQGEHANFRNKIQIGDKVTRSEDGVLVNLSQLKRVAKKDEKQGVQKPVDVRTIGYWHVEDVEQKPANKVEPKFKVEDWVVWDNKISCHVDNIYQGKNSLMYTITDANNMTRSYSVKGFDINAHLWTIQDAKDGDVLVCGNDIVIFKENNYNPKDKSGCMFVYCSCNNFYEIGGINPTDYKPATKEQRDLLFKKMKEAGYEWDAEKKKLKKIEQKPDEEYNITGIGSKNAQGKLGEMIKNLNTAWSDDDERYLSYAIHAVEDMLGDYGKNTVAWLKSIKDRVHPQQQEWSEEDENIALGIEQLCNCASLLNIAPDKIDKIRTWLKSLKP